VGPTAAQRIREAESEKGRFSVFVTHITGHIFRDLAFKRLLAAICGRIVTYV
jgi:hypothetical protein